MKWSLDYKKVACTSNPKIFKKWLIINNRYYYRDITDMLVHSHFKKEDKNKVLTMMRILKMLKKNSF